MSVLGAVPSSSLVNCNLDQAGRGWAIGLYAMLSADEAANADGTEALHRRLDHPGGIGQSASLRPAGEPACRRCPSASLVRWPPDIAWLASRTGPHGGLAFV